MFTKNSRKGFTIVELVIVIAIIAILATALIPTFGGLIGSANRTVDEQLVRQINTYLMLEEAINGKPATVADVQKILTDNGLTPVKANLADNTIYWVGAENRAIIWTADGDTGSVTYPEEYAEKYKAYTAPSVDWDDLSQTAQVIVPEEATQEKFLEAIAAADASESDNVVVRLPKNATISVSSAALNAAFANGSGNGKDVTIDLNGGELVADNSATVTVPIGGSLVISNGEMNISVPVDAKGTKLAAIAVESGASVVLRDVTFETDGPAVYPAGDASEVVIEDCVIKGGGYGVGTNATTSDNIKITIRNSYIEGSAAVFMNVPGELVVENCEIYGWNMAVTVRNGSAVIDNCNLYTNFNLRWDYFLHDDSWGSGNSLPCAALMVGNNNHASYMGTPTCTVTNTNIHVIEGTMAMYVEGNLSEQYGATLNCEGIKIYSYADSTYTNGAELTGVAPVEYASTLTAEQRALVYTNKTASFVTINGTVLQDGQ